MVGRLICTNSYEHFFTNCLLRLKKVVNGTLRRSGVQSPAPPSVGIKLLFCSPWESHHEVIRTGSVEFLGAITE